MTLTNVREIDFNILLKTELKDLNNVCKTNSYIDSICKDDYFWKEKVSYDYGNDIVLLKPETETYKT